MNEMIVILSEGKRHDLGMLADSCLLSELELYAFSTTPADLCVRRSDLSTTIKILIFILVPNFCNL